jgi:hypothetical protein
MIEHGPGPRVHTRREAIAMAERIMPDPGNSHGSRDTEK